MLHFLLTRLAWSVVVMLVVSMLSFGLYALAPGDPARLLLQASGMNPVPEEAVAAKRAEMRLDEPVPIRYLTWLGGAVQGDLGRSFRSYQPVTSLYLERLPATLLLALLATTLSCIIAVPLGTLAAYHQGRPLDGLAQAVAVTGVALPSFWVALIAMFVFAATLQWLPAFGSLTPQGIVLPAGVLALANLAILTRLTRATVLDVLSQEYVMVARAKGLSHDLIARRHLLPNAVVPILTVLGLELAHTLTGAVVVEYIFAWPGIGKLAVDAALFGDVPIVVGFATLAGLAFVLINLTVDIWAAFLDPRVRRA
jgi:ABC-type dipeptide/oligopeptide/nickel transport system permease component